MLSLWSYKAVYGFWGVVLAGLGLVLVAGDGMFFWLGMEVASFGFLGVMFSGEASAVSTAKYFIPNAVGGLVFLGGVLGGASAYCMGGMLLKLGVVPLHFWVGSVCESLGPLSLAAFLGPLKLSPLLGLLYFGGDSVLLLAWSGCAVVMGGLYGLQQNSVSRVLGYSSIISGGWISVGCVWGVTVAVSYWLFYTVCLVGLVVFGWGVGGDGSMIFLVFFALLGGAPAGGVLLGKWTVLSGLGLFSGNWLVAGGVVLSLGVFLGIAMYTKVVVSLVARGGSDSNVRGFGGVGVGALLFILLAGRY